MANLKERPQNTDLGSDAPDGDRAHQQATRIYVSPTAQSLRAFSEICNSEEARCGIVELVFLVEALRPGHGVDDSMVYMEYCEDRVNLYGHDMPADFIFSTKTLEENFAMYKELLKRIETDRDATESVLAACLPKLSSLRKVRLVSRIDAPGLNEDPFFYADHYQSNNSTSSAEDQRGNACLAAQMAAEEMSDMQGVDILFSVLHRNQIPITALEIGNGLNDQAAFEHSGRENAVSVKSMQAVTADLEHLSVSVHNYYDEASNIWRAFLGAAKNLQSLRIYAEQPRSGRTWHQPQAECSVLSMALAHDTFCDLHTSEVIGKLDQPTNVRAVMLNHFLVRHSTTLRKIELSGVLVVNWYNPDSMKSTMASSVRKMKATLQLDSAKMLLHRRNEHANKACWPEDGDGTKCDETCTKYAPSRKGFKWISVEQLHDLATELDVELKGGEWDFGEFLMR